MSFPTVLVTFGKFAFEMAPPSASGVASGFYTSGATYADVEALSALESGSVPPPSSVGPETDFKSTMGAEGCHGPVMRAAMPGTVRSVACPILRPLASYPDGTVAMSVSILMVSGMSAFTTCECLSIGMCAGDLTSVHGIRGESGFASVTLASPLVCIGT